MQMPRALVMMLALAGAGITPGLPASAQTEPPQSTPQTAPEILRSPVLTIDQQELFEESDFAKTSLERLEAESRALQAEIRQIESDLEIEERLLTERRATLTPSEFLPLASAFDEKVKGIRTSWLAKDRDLQRQREEDKQKFYEAAFPILAEVMQDHGAAMLLDRNTVILSLDRVDITQTAIDRINARLSTDDIEPTEPADTP